MVDVIKKQIVVFSICFLFSFVICFLYPIKEELYLGIKNVFDSETVVSSKDIITVNYKRSKDNSDEFIVSGGSPILIVNLNNKYIEYIKINFKEQLKENLQLKIYIEKQEASTDNELIKIKDIETLKDKVSYGAKIKDVFKNLILFIGDKVGDSFIIDNITYSENYKFYWDKISQYNYLNNLKKTDYWLNVLKLFILFVLIAEYFVVRRYIYKKIGIIK